MPAARPAPAAAARAEPGEVGNPPSSPGAGPAIHAPRYPLQLLSPDPEARRVSHGCIRLTNESARELMHLVDVGATVLVY